MNPNYTVLGRNGYVLKKGHVYPPIFIDELKTELTVAPKDNGYGLPRKFRLYQETRRGDIVFPRFYGQNRLGVPNRVAFKSNEQRDYKFAGKLRKEQLKPATAILEALSTQGGGILSVKTGGGKTMLAIYCMYKLQCTSIVVVNKVELVKQWKKEIVKFIPNARVGEIRGDIFDVHEKDIVVGMVNTLSMKNFPCKVFDIFDFLVVDECHTVASEIFHQCMPRLRCPYTLGLSATPDRDDGLMQVVKWFLGDIVYKSKDKVDSKLDVLVNVVKYRGKKEYASELIAFNEKPNIAKMLNVMCEDATRTNILVWIITELYNQHEDRNILVLADRKKLLKTLKKRLVDLGMSAELFIGEMKTEEYEEAKKKRIILGSYQICGTGFNLPKLNTLVMATPRKKVEQMVGRILRKQHDIHPVVVDLWDTFSIFQYMGAARVRFYKELSRTQMHGLKFTPSLYPGKKTKGIPSLLQMCSQVIMDSGIKYKERKMPQQFKDIRFLSEQKLLLEAVNQTQEEE